MKYYVYILYSANVDKYYIGYTSDLTNRLKKHNAKHKGFTGRNSDWQLKYHEEFKTQTEAIRREKQIKNWKSRQKIKQLISSQSSAG